VAKINLEIYETKSTVLVQSNKTSIEIIEQPISITVNQSGVVLNAKQSAATLVIQEANVSLGITNSVNTIELANGGPQGIPGIQGLLGPANTLTIGSITGSDSGGDAEATLTGTAPNQTLNLVIPRGLQGESIVGPQGESVSEERSIAVTRTTIEQQTLYHSLRRESQ
jgi:hypothetical protein